MKHSLSKCGLILITGFWISGCGNQQSSKNSESLNDTSLNTNSDTVQAISEDKLIVPGNRIGKIIIGGNADSLKDILGKPDFTEGAMGSGSMAWNNNGYKTTVLFSHAMGTKDEQIARIRKIRITSPDFKTAERLNTGLTLNDYKKRFDLTLLNNPMSKTKIKVYEAKGKGITFEIDSVSNQGVGIIVHQPEDSLFTDLH